MLSRFADDLRTFPSERQNMNQLQAMRVFTRVVDLSSFALAARQLGMSATAVTRSVGMLETHLNMRLLNRTTRSLSLTDVGREYLDGCRAIITKLDELESNLAETTRDPCGTLRIATPSIFATSSLSALLTTYRAMHPRVAFDVTTFDTSIDMIEGGFDVCFSVDPRLASSTLVCRTLTTIQEVIVATPTYLAHHGAPAEPADLSRHGLLSVTDGASRIWEFSDGRGTYRVNTGSPLTSSSNAMVRTATLSHMGIALLPLPLVADDLAHGSLVPVLERFVVNGGPLELSLLYSGRNYLSARVRSFVDFIVQQYRSTERPVKLRAVA